MAEEETFEPLPFDVIDVPMPEIIPLKWLVVVEFFNDYKYCLALLETWVRVHLRAFAAHTRSPTPNANNLIDEIDDEAINETKDKVFQEFNRSHVKSIEKPIDYEMKDEDLKDDANIDQRRLLEPARKKKMGIFQKCLLKCKLKKKTKEEEKRDPQLFEGLEWARRQSFEQLKDKFSQFLDEEVCRHREKMGERVITPENLETVEGLWISEKVHCFHVCHMAIKILDIVREKCADFADHLAFEDLETTHAVFKGKHSNRMQSRLAYLETTKTLVLIMVSDIEKMLRDNKTYAECVEMFLRVLPRSERKLFSKKDSMESTVIKCMKDGESVLRLTSPSHERIAENMLKSESQQNLLLAVEEEDTNIRDHSMFDTRVNTSGSSADLTPPNVVYNLRVPATTPKVEPLALRSPVLENVPELNTKQCLYYEPKPKANSTSGYSREPLLSQSPDDTLEDSSPRGGKPSFLSLPDPLPGISRQEPTSKEGSTSPMQISPPEKIPSDEDSTDN